jgi:hypothetical protein
VDVEDVPAPQDIRLEANYPNPFNPSTVLAYTLGTARHVRLVVHDALGRQVAVLADGLMDAGRHQVEFDAADLAGGLYTARLTVDGASQTRKMLLMK